MNLMPFDELNTFKAQLVSHFDEEGHIRSRKDCDDIIDEMLDLYLLACADGAEQVNADMGTDYSIGVHRAADIIEREVAGKTWRERVNDYFETGGTIADIERIAETEMHRDYNEAGYVTAEAVGATTKVWHCLMLPDSRDEHILLDGVTAPIDGYFYTYTGAYAMFPGEFGDPENDCNCLCYCTYQ